MKSAKNNLIGVNLKEIYNWMSWWLEIFHRRIKEDLFDTKAISKLKRKLKNNRITKQDLKKEVLKLLNKYIINFNNHLYSNHKPRYGLFWNLIYKLKIY